MTDDLQHSLREEFEKLTKQLRRRPEHIAPTIETDDASNDDMLFYQTLGTLLQRTKQVVNNDTQGIHALRDAIDKLIENTNRGISRRGYILDQIPRMSLIDDIMSIDEEISRALQVSNTSTSDTMLFMEKIKRVSEVLKHPTMYFHVTTDNAAVIDTAYNVASAYINIIYKIVEIMRTEYESEKWRALGSEINMLVGGIEIPGLQETNKATLNTVAINITDAMKNVSDARKSLIVNLTALADYTDNAFISVDAMDFNSKVASMTQHGDSIDEVLKVTTKIGHRLAASAQNSLRSKTELGNNFLALIVVFLSAIKVQIARRVLFYDETGSAQAMSEFIEQQILPLKNNILTIVPWYQTQMDSAIATIKENVNEALNEKRKLLDTSIGIIEKILGHLTWDNVSKKNVHAVGSTIREIEKHMTEERITQTHTAIQAAYEEVMKRWEESINENEIETVTKIRAAYEHGRAVSLRHNATQALKEFIDEVNRDYRTKETGKLEDQVGKLTQENEKLRHQLQDIIQNGPQNMEVQHELSIPSSVDLAKILFGVMQHPENDHNTQLDGISTHLNVPDRTRFDQMIEYLKRHKVNTNALNTAMQGVHDALLHGSSPAPIVEHMTVGAGAGPYTTTVDTYVKENQEYQKTMKLIKEINGGIAKLKELGEHLERLAGTGIHDDSQMSTLNGLTTQAVHMQFERLKIPTQACMQYTQELVKSKRDDGVAAVEALILAMEKIEDISEDAPTEFTTKLVRMCADSAKETNLKGKYDKMVTSLAQLMSDKEASAVDVAETAEVTRLNAQVAKMQGDLQQSQEYYERAINKLLEVYRKINPDGYDKYLNETTDTQKKSEADFVWGDIMECITQILVQSDKDREDMDIHIGEVERLEEEAKNHETKMSEIGKALGLIHTLITDNIVLQKAKDVMQTIRDIHDTVLPFPGGDNAARQGYNNQPIDMQLLVTNVKKIKDHADTLLDQIQQDKNTYDQTITEIYYSLNPPSPDQQKTIKTTDETLEAARNATKELRADRTRLIIFDDLIKNFDVDNTVNKDIMFRDKVTQMKEKHEKLEECINKISQHMLGTPYEDIKIDESIAQIQTAIETMKTQNLQMVQTIQALQTNIHGLQSKIAEIRQSDETFKHDTKTHINVIWNVLCGDFKDIPPEDIEKEEEYTPKGVDISFKRLMIRAYHVRKELDGLEKKVSEQSIDYTKPQQSNDDLVLNFQTEINAVWEILCGEFEDLPEEAFKDEVQHMEEHYDVTPLELKVRAYKVRKEMDELRAKVKEYTDNPKNLKILSVSTNKLNNASRLNKAKVLKQRVNNTSTTNVQKAVSAFKRHKNRLSQSNHLSTDIDPETSELENFTYTALMLLIFYTDQKHQISVYDECILRFTVNVLFALVNSKETDQISQCLVEINNKITSKDPIPVIIESVRTCGNMLYELVGQPESIQLCEEDDNPSFTSLLREISQCINQVDNHGTDGNNSKDTGELQHVIDLEGELLRTREELRQAEAKEKAAVDAATETRAQAEDFRKKTTEIIQQSENRITQLNEELERLQFKHKESIKQKEEEIRQKEKEIEEKEERIRQLTEESSDIRHEETSGELDTLQQQLQNLRAEKDLLISEHREETEKLREELEKTHKEVQSKQEELTALEKKYNDTKRQNENDISDLTGRINDLIIDKGKDKRIARMALERFTGNCDIFTLDQLCTVPHKDLATDIQYIVHDGNFHKFAKAALEQVTFGISPLQEQTLFEPDEDVHINMLREACKIYVNIRLINLKTKMLPYTKNKEMLLLLSEFMCAIIQQHRQELSDTDFAKFYKNAIQTINSSDNSLTKSDQLITQLQKWIMGCIDVNENIAHTIFTIDKDNIENTNLSQLLEEKHNSLTTTVLVSPLRFSS